MVLAFDVSASMAATDLTPTRMAAAKAAAKAFVQAQPASVAIGVVAFSDCRHHRPGADQRPGDGARGDRPPGAQKGTSLGQGIAASLKADQRGRDAADRRLLQQPLARADGLALPRCRPAATPRRSIVLLTDGENNEAPDPQAAAQTAADRGVRIDTVGIGTDGGSGRQAERLHRAHAARRGHAPAGGARSPAARTSRAADAAQLPSLYAGLHPRLAIQPTAARDHRAGRRAGPAVPDGRRRGLARLAGAAAMMDLLWAGCARPAGARADPGGRATSGPCGGGARPAVRYSSLSLVREAMPGTSRLRRHLPFAIFLAAVAASSSRSRGRPRSWPCPPTRRPSC